MKIQTKRVYEPATAADGYRILVDRLWPRGLTKEAAGVDRWMKDVAPSHELRKWFHANMDQWEEFNTRYQAELKGSGALQELRSLVAEKDLLTLLFAAKTEDRNQALVLKDLLEKS
ncbi:DUF488 domain-containing protein [Dyadobacter sp. MSC1_007]|jgi:uncharacterized protein YeaO (DUF488 family)|uniref:DUF488 domain-containing protein n=1 Tax=Dyadobacter sp. MSC1_007 TaxID=2909264 RepID=UPI0020308A59|nr:DUF488 family protein [Dyadobacter sp. MSC1_007]